MSATDENPDESDEAMLEASDEAVKLAESASDIVEDETEAAAGIANSLREPVADSKAAANSAWSMGRSGDSEENETGSRSIAEAARNRKTEMTWRRGDGEIGEANAWWRMIQNITI
jgi:hypothetical protein